LVDNILDLSLETSKIYNFRLVSSLNRYLYMTSDKVDKNYIEVLTSQVPVKKNNILKIIDHAFVSYKSYTKFGQLGFLDEVYNNYFENFIVEDITLYSFKNLVKVLNRNDEEILRKIEKADLTKLNVRDSLLDLLATALHRYELTKDQKLLNHIFESFKSVEDYKIDRIYVAHLFNKYMKNYSELSSNTDISTFFENLYKKCNTVNLLNAKCITNSRIFDYMVKTDKPLNDLVESPKFNSSHKAKIFKLLLSYDKQPAVRDEIFKNNPYVCLFTLSNKLDLIVEKMMLNLDDETKMAKIYEIISNDRFKIKFMTQDVKYALRWLEFTKPETVKKLVSESLNSDDFKFLSNQFNIVVKLLNLAGVETEVKSLSNIFDHSAILVKDSVIVVDSITSEVKNVVLNKVFPSKKHNIIKIRTVLDIKSAEDVENLFKSLGLITDNLTAEQIKSINEYIAQEKPGSKQSKDAKKSKTSHKKYKDDTNSSKKTDDHSESSSDIEIDTQSK